MSGSQSVQETRKVVEQLRREKNFQRTPISVCAQDLIRFVQENHREDCLLNGFPSDKMNPYRSKNAIQCLVL
ncbi:GGL domain-containing protein [Aphelenchoides avenae]|nr:GGL domain-containing protein [Aphelenchus avenae]